MTPAINAGFPTNIPTMFGGREVDEDTAIEIIRKNGGRDPETGNMLKPFRTLEQAESAAKRRSQQIESIIEGMKRR